MNWAKLIGYILGGVALIVLGWLLHSAFIPKPINTTHTVKDTVYVPQSFQGHQENTRPQVKPAVPPDTGNGIKPREPIKEYSDTLKVRNEKYSLEVPHKVVDDNGAVSNFWDWSLKFTNQEIETKKDSIRTMVDTRYITKPFFLDPYFYLSVIELALIVIAIIF